MKQPKIIIDYPRCDFCGTCVAVCPADAIELKEAYISINQEICTVCENCVAVCPLGLLEVGA